MQAISFEEAVHDAISAVNANPDTSEMIEGFGSRLAELLGAEKAMVKDLHRRSEKLNTAEEFALNTGKPYLDNRLSGYSAFGELINYFNSGYKSCLMLPFAAGTKKLGVVTLLSSKEEAFDQARIGVIAMACSLFSYGLSAKLEAERNMNLVGYFDAAFENVVPQLIADKSGRVLKANKSMLNIMEKTLVELPGADMYGFFGISAEMLEKMRKGIVVNVVLKSGRGFSVSARRISETLTHMLFYETTYIKELEAKARFLERGKDEAFLILSKDTTILWASNNMPDAFRVDKENIVGRKLVDIVDGTRFKKELEALEKDAYIDYIRIKLDNNLFFDAKCTVFREDTGFSVILGKNTERFVKEVIGDAREAIRLSGDAVIMTDHSGYMKSANRSAEKMLGYKSSEIEGMPLLNICADSESKERLGFSLNIAREKSVVSDVSVRLLGKSGQVLPFQEYVKTVKAEDGRISGYMLIGRELSSKMLIQDLRIKIDELARDMEKSEAEGKLKTQFIYNISHDLKTPITNIMGFSKLLLGGEFGPVNEEQRKNINIIIDEANRLMQLIQQILDVAKLSSGKIKLDLQMVDFREIKENPSVKSLAEVAVNKGLTFSFDVDYTTPEISADPNRLVQVFVNLIGNAIKFTEEGGISVKIMRKNKNVRVEVHDTGVGISREDKAKLFKKFFQLPRKGLTRQEGAGTGLGLTITKEIVNLHGGRISVDSEPGRGSTFWFTLPIYGKPKKKQEQRQEEPEAGQEM